MTYRNKKRSNTVLCLVSVLLLVPMTIAGAEGEQKPLKVTNVAGPIALRHYMDVTVEGLNEWSQQPGHDPTKFVLVIDGTPIEGLPSNPLYNNSILRFDLNADFSKKSWQAILSRHLKEFLTPASKVTLPVTVKQEGVVVADYKNAQLTIIDWFGGWLVIFIVSFLVAIGLFWWLARESDILRDNGPQPVGNNKRGKAYRKPYSLARTQMAFWFFSIVISFIFIWMLTSELPALTTGVLGLMGISAATGLGAAVVDSGKRTGEENERDALEQKKKSTEAEIEKLNAEIAALQASTKANPAPADLDQQLALLAEKQSQVATKNKEIQQDEAVIKKLDEGTRPTPSKSFVKDILSDDDGISFHRFQIAAWTIVLILIFLAKVFHQFSMPEFDGTLLALMGISAGTYIGFKLPNQQG